MRGLNYKFLALLVALVGWFAVESSYAQHTFGVYSGWGSGSIRVYPAIENKSVYGNVNAGFSWRTYSKQAVVGCFGIDLEFIQRGYGVNPSTSSLNEGDPIYYYTRQINSIMLPIVWQPHVYMFHRRLRIFAEAAATFSYDISSTYDNDIARQAERSGVEYSGDYEYITPRDNRFGYGLMFGGGAAILIERFEILFKARYFMGYSDVMRNRNKYYYNSDNDVENPFGLTPIRSPMDNISFSFGINYRFSADGFKSWDHKKIKKTKKGHEFDYQGVKEDNKGKNVKR
ncbi:MAG: outer membrane beta-barrel protein [Rikenellaceae bacterium]